MSPFGFMLVDSGVIQAASPIEYSATAARMCTVSSPRWSVRGGVPECPSNPGTMSEDPGTVETDEPIHEDHYARESAAVHLRCEPSNVSPPPAGGETALRWRVPVSDEMQREVTGTLRHDLSGGADEEL
jgi:hypothetical protein